MNPHPWIRYQDFVIRLRRSSNGYQVEALAPNGNVEAFHPSPKELLQEIHKMVSRWHEDLDPVLILGSTQIAEQIELGGSPPPGLRQAWDQMQTALRSVENILEQAGWQDTRTMGQKLREFLLPKTSGVWERFCRTLKAAEEEGKRLRLRLAIEAEELMGIPWEYLYVEEFESLPTSAEARRGVDWPFHRTSGFLAADGSISIVRQVSLDYRMVKLPRANQLRILVIASNPPNDPLWPPLRVEEELRQLQAALQEQGAPLERTHPEC